MMDTKQNFLPSLGITTKMQVMVQMHVVLFLYFILPLVACPLWGQVMQKRELTPDDYHLWGEMRLNGVSPDGKWASYVMDYQDSNDTLFVRSTDAKKTYHFTAARMYEFTTDNRFVVLNNKSLSILNLKSGTRKNIDNVQQYAYSKQTGQLALLCLKDRQERNLIIIDSKNDVVEEMDAIESFSLSPSGKEMLYTRKTGHLYNLGLIHLGTVPNGKWIMKKSPLPFDHFTWQKHGDAVAFFSYPKATGTIVAITYYNLITNTFIQLLPETQVSFPTDKMITDDYRYPMSISEDGKKIFFAIKNISRSDTFLTESIVEQWNTTDKWIYPQQQYFGKPEDKPNLAVWFPLKKSVTIISDTALPEAMLAGNDNFAMLCNPQTNEPSMKDTAPRNLYLMDLYTGNKEPFLQNVEDYQRNILPSPQGRYIAYYYEQNWWVYDLKLKTHSNITEKIGVSFQGEMYHQIEESPYGHPGWSKNEKELILYDQYDIWAFKPDGTSRRLTSGREKKIQFRIAYLLGQDFRQSNYEGYKSSLIDLDNTVILRAEGSDGKTGYFKWTGRTKEKALVYKQLLVDQMHYNTKNNSLIYQQQDFNQSPALIYQQNNRKSKIFYQSNPQQKKFYWGKSELISYKNRKGKKLQGILYYPANYDSAKKYPMIVHIYEKQSQKLHLYYNPSLLEQVGYNPAVFTSMGYFVLCPDIEYETGMTGQSALDCVTSATLSVIAMGVIQSDRVALMGHSFGGYESAFIATQTYIFATVVVGAAATNLTSFYYTVGWNTGKPEMYRFESDQYRLKSTPIEDPSVYNDNSPIVAVANLKTPVLLWTGKKDLQVDWHQSVEFYLAMRRLGKKSIMLLYPEEEHSMLKPKNQKDLSIRIQQWFDYFLKGEQPDAWIRKGVQ